MKLFNTTIKEKELFVPQEKNAVKMYVCGPTVYDYAHIGNLLTYINTDLLRRWLSLTGYNVTEVMNVTDIEDKIIKRSSEEGISYKIVTQKFEKSFKEDLGKLEIKLPEKMPHATDPDVIDEIIKIIEKLLDKEIAYKSSDGSIYFSISKIDDYGKLSNVDLSGIKAGARIDQDEYEKDCPRDFVLWKKRQGDEPFWKASFGEGRPGWHIECSAMAIKYLGETIDIHAGGIDLLFPHHENEIAQSKAYTGKDFVRYWFHCEHLLIEGQKMSKSLKNVYTLNEMIEKYDVEPLALRMFALLSHYRERSNFTKDSITQAQNTLDNLRDFVLKNLETKGPQVLSIDKTRTEIKNALNDDLNTPKALSILFEYIRSVNIAQAYGKDVYDFMIELDKFLGLRLSEIKPADIPHDILGLVKKREEARKNKDWETSDQCRLKIKSRGYEIEDAPEGSKVKKIR